MVFRKIMIRLGAHDPRSFIYEAISCLLCMMVLELRQNEDLDMCCTTFTARPSYLDLHRQIHS